MEQRFAEIERRLDALAVRLEELERRQGLPVAIEASPPDLVLPSFADVPLLAGRSCLVLAGAYLLRSLTAADFWPRPAGALAGSAYAAIWWLAAERESAHGRRLSASSYAWCASLVIFPLLWEATGDMHALSPVTGALLWMTFMAWGTAVGVHHRASGPLASIVGLGFPIGAGLLLRGDGAWLLSAFLVVTAVSTLYLADRGRARLLLWLPTGMLCTAALLLSLAGLMSNTPEWLSPAPLARLQWAVLASYLAYFIARISAGGATLTAGHGLVFAVLTIIAALTTRLPWAEASSTRAWALAASIVAVIGWVLAHHASARSQWLWRVPSLGLLLYGTALAFPPGWREISWVLLILACAPIAYRAPSYGWAAVLFAVGLTWTTRLLPIGLGATASGEEPGRIAASGAFGALLAALLLMSIHRHPDSDPDSILPVRAGMLGLVTVGAAALGLRFLPAAHIPTPTLAALAVLLSYRWTGRPEARLVGLTAAIGAGLQVIVRDLLGGPPADQFLGFATLGVGIIGATVILKGRES